MIHPVYLWLWARPASGAARGSRVTTPSAVTVDVAARAENDQPELAPWQLAARVRSDVDALAMRAASVEVSPGLRARIEAQMSDADAATWGQRVATVDLLNDVLDGVPGVIDAALAGGLTGFGPCAMRYMLDLAVQLAAHWASLVTQRRMRAVAASQKVLSVDEVLACRTELARRLDGVLRADDPERAALERAAKLPTRNIEPALSSIEAMLPTVAMVFARAEEDADERAYLDDQGFTEASMAALLAPVNAALASRDAHRGARNAVSATQQQIDRVEGRLRDQLMRLRRAVQAAREKGAILPEVRMERTLSRAAKKSEAEEPAPTPDAPQPAPR